MCAVATVITAHTLVHSLHVLGLLTLPPSYPYYNDARLPTYTTYYLVFAWLLDRTVDFNQVLLHNLYTEDELLNI